MGLLSKKQYITDQRSLSASPAWRPGIRLPFFRKTRPVDSVVTRSFIRISPPSASTTAAGLHAPVCGGILRMNADPTSPVTARIRRRWNASEVVEVCIDTLWDLHFRDEPGGVCRALPRAFLCAHVWCDKLPVGALGHLCRTDPPVPHELLVCILPTDNAAEIYAALGARARG